MIQLDKIQIQNFRSILDVTVELSPITVLVGKTGTGKSNFVDAICYLRDLLATGKPAQHFRPAMAREASLYYDLHFRVNSRPFRYSLSLNDKLLVVNELLEVDGTPLFHQKLVKPPSQHQWTVEPKIANVPGPGSLALPKLPVLRDAVIAYTILTAGVGCYSFSGDVLEAPTTTPVADGLMDDAGNFLTVMKDILTDLKDLDVRMRMTETLRCVNPTLTSVELDNINDPKRVIVGHAQGSGKIIDIGLANESEGFRRFYAHLLALYQRPSKQFLIFEHPEDGIHPGALSLLAEEFKVAAESGRGQVLLTTHSPRLLDSFEPDEIRVVELDGLQTRIGMLAKEQRESLEEDLLDSGDLLTVDPARIDRPEQ